MLKLDRGTRWDHDVPEDLIGVVHNAVVGKPSFLHVECFSTYESLKDAIADDDGFIAVKRGDTWKLDIGPCVKCGALADEPAREAV